MGKQAADLAGADQPKKKQHRKKNEKLVKKRSFKRNKKKFLVERQNLRKIKEDKDDMRKFGLISKEFADTVPADQVYDLKMTIKKMLKHSQSDSFGPDIVGLFQQLDHGNSVNINKLTDDYLKGKMLKVFGLLRLQHGKASQGKALKFVKRTSALHEFSLAKLISHLFSQIQKEQENEDEKDLSEDDEFNSESESVMSDHNEPV